LKGCVAHIRCACCAAALTLPCLPSTPEKAAGCTPATAAAPGTACCAQMPPAALLLLLPCLAVGNGLHLPASMSSVVNSSHSRDLLKWGPPSWRVASANASGSAPCCSSRLSRAGSTGCDSGTGRKQGRGSARAPRCCCCCLTSAAPVLLRCVGDEGCRKGHHNRNRFSKD
jgi:hypothetical protein